MQQNSSHKFLIGIIIFLILLVGGGGGALFWYATKSSPKLQQKQITRQDDLKSQEQTLMQLGAFYTLNPIVIDLKNLDGKDVQVKMTFVLELNTKLLVYELDRKKSIIRNKIIKILSKKTLADIDSTSEKDKLCMEIKKSLNAILVDGKIKHVYMI